MGFVNSSFIIVDSEGLKGGLMLLWKDNIQVSLHNFSKAHVDVFVTDMEGKKWRFTETNRLDRRHTWELMRRLHSLRFSMDL